MPLIEMPSESRLLALLYLCLPHSAHRVWDNHSLQRGCLRRSVRCIWLDTRGLPPAAIAYGSAANGQMLAQMITITANEVLKRLA